MKAIRYYNYGSPDVLKLEDVEMPTPNDEQVLIKVHAASVNSFEHRHLRATPFLIRIENGLFKPKNPKLGADIAGTVEGVGSKVTQFKVGDEVFGNIGYGGYAEYVCSRENKIAHKPASISFEVAAASPMAALTALQGLRDKGQIQAGQKVLINGASGGVGTFAVMIAKYYGADVTGVCSTRNLEMVRSIGADQVIDYTKEDFTQNGPQYDLIFDIAANRSVFAYQRALTPKGKYVKTGFSTIPHMLHIVLLGERVAKGEQRIFNMGLAKVNQADLTFIGELLASKKIVPVIDKVYPLSETSQALHQFEKVHAQGKIVITVA
ncbi:MAG TPA: alcohol dehydrogenase [Anaerolineae bacterium]|nr:alcohol dehydrogenase [Anaerolineae bacterium]